MAQARKLIVISGVTSGLGSAMVEFFNRVGSHTVIGCGRTSAKIHGLNMDASSSTEFKKFHVVDVSVDEEVKNWADEIISNFGVPDILINNASVVNKTATFWKIPSQDFDQVLDVNVNGVANCMRHFLPEMIKAKKGTVVNLSAAWGKTVSPRVSAYCTSKFAIEGLSKSVASELPDPLTCVPLDPGVIHTAMLEKIFGKAASKQQSPQDWVEKAGPLILGIDRSMNGKSVKVK